MTTRPNITDQACSVCGRRPASTHIAGPNTLCPKCWSLGQGARTVHSASVTIGLGTAS
jgi:hypothetical protein